MIELEQVYDEFNNGERNSNIDFGKDIGDMSQGQDTAREDFNMINTLLILLRFLIKLFAF